MAVKRSGKWTSSIRPLFSTFRLPFLAPQSARIAAIAGSSLKALADLAHAAKWKAESMRRTGYADYSSMVAKNLKAKSLRKSQATLRPGRHTAAPANTTAAEMARAARVERLKVLLSLRAAAIIGSPNKILVPREPVSGQDATLKAYDWT